MIDFLFTLDYEVYGNGTGSLAELVYEPGQQLEKIFRKHNARFVNFVEVAEFEKIEALGTDPAIDLVKEQIRAFHRDGFEIALHLHPQWCNARPESGGWRLDYSEYNLCTLQPARIEQIVEGALQYLRGVVGQPDFTPLSFRAGNWLFQPSRHAAAVLAQNGIRLDSSVFKGGLQHNHGLDYRRTMRHGYHWNFVSDVTVPDATGEWFEVPIYTEMVPVWRMSTSKRMAFNRRKAPASPMAPPKDAATKWNRMRDFMRWRYPLKLDFCRMTMDELVAMTGRIIQADRADPATYRPIVAIGHTKDLTDPHTVDEFLSFLGASGIPVVTFKDVIGKLAQQRAALGALVAVEI